MCQFTLNFVTKSIASIHSIFFILITVNSITEKDNNFLLFYPGIEINIAMGIY